MIDFNALGVLAIELDLEYAERLLFDQFLRPDWSPWLIGLRLECQMVSVRLELDVVWVPWLSLVVLTGFLNASLSQAHSVLVGHSHGVAVELWLVAILAIPLQVHLLLILLPDLLHPSLLLGLLVELLMHTFELLWALVVVGLRSERWCGLSKDPILCLLLLYLIHSLLAMVIEVLELVVDQRGLIWSDQEGLSVD